jgi:hypothetical protein
MPIKFIESVIEDMDDVFVGYIVYGSRDLLDLKKRDFDLYFIGLVVRKDIDVYTENLVRSGLASIVNHIRDNYIDVMDDIRNQQIPKIVKETEPNLVWDVPSQRIDTDYTKKPILAVTVPVTPDYSYGAIQFAEWTEVLIDVAQRKNNLPTDYNFK